MNVLSQLPILFAIALAIWLAAVLIRRGCWRGSPLFTAYVFYSVVSMLARMATVPNYRLYFAVYWITEAVDACLSLAATYEAFVAAFRGFFLLKWVRFILPGVAVFVIAASIWKAIAMPPVHAGRLVATIVGLEGASQYLIAGSAVAFIVLERILKPSYIRFRYGVVCGFGAASLGSLLATLLVSDSGTKFKLIVTWSASVGYVVALGIWLLAAYTGETQPPSDSGLDPKTVLQELRLYGAALRKKES
jgi:hypothetical protein